MAEKQDHLILEVKDVVKTYQTGGIPFTALNQVSIDIKAGEFLGITGKSGAGKTTLLNVISGVTELTGGSIYFHARGNDAAEEAIPIHQYSEDQLAAWRGKNVGIVYQSFELMPTLSLVENVMLPPDFSGTFQPLTTHERALELFEMVDVREHAYKIPAHFRAGKNSGLPLHAHW